VYQAATTDIIRIRTGEAIDTNQLPWTSHAKRLDTTSGRLEALVPLAGLTSGTENVTVSTAPTSGKHKALELLTIINRDAVEHTVIVEAFDGTTATIVHSGTLSVDEKIEYSRGLWRTYSPDGILIDGQGVTGATGPTGATGATGAAGPGLVAGGSTGQLIRKASGTDYDTAWVDWSAIISGAASSIITSDLTTRRQLISNSSGKVAVAPGVGSFCYQSPLKPLATGFVANTNGFSTSTAVGAADIQRITPWAWPWDLTIDRIGLSVSVGAASSTAKIIIFDCDADGRPTTNLATSASIATDSAATVYDTSFPFTFEAHKWYWIGVWFSGNPTVRVAAQYVPHGWQDGSSPFSLRLLQRSVSYAGANTDWNYSNSQYSSNIPILVFMRVA